MIAGCKTIVGSLFILATIILLFQVFDGFHPLLFVTVSPDLPAVFAMREPCTSELAWWWSQPLKVVDVKDNHLESKFFPVNLSNPALKPDDLVGAKYTRGWRRDSLMRMLGGFNSLCRNLNLTYWLDSGSLLGRRRSDGQTLIPWDLDADVGMLRDEFKKLNESLNQGGRVGLSRNLDFGLPDGIIVWSRQRWTDDFASARDSIIPARIIDTRTGFYVDIFGGFFIRKDGDLQMFWPWVPGPKHRCNYWNYNDYNDPDDSDDNRSEPNFDGSAYGRYDDELEDTTTTSTELEDTTTTTTTSELVLDAMYDQANESQGDFDQDGYDDWYTPQPTYEPWDRGGRDDHDYSWSPPPMLDSDCQGPCGAEYCYKFPAQVVLPTMPCSLSGIKDWLQCPNREAAYIEVQYGATWSQPDHVWDPGKRDFVARGSIPEPQHNSGVDISETLAPTSSTSEFAHSRTFEP